MPSIVNVSASWYEIDDDELATDQTSDEVPDAISFMSMVFIGEFFTQEIPKKKCANSEIVTSMNPNHKNLSSNRFSYNFFQLSYVEHERSEEKDWCDNIIRKGGN